MARFIAGLRPQLQKILQQFDPCSVSEARQRALLVEQQTRLGATQWSGNSRPRSTTIADDTKSATWRDSTTTSTGPRNNNRTGEPVATVAEPRPSRPNTLCCFTCGERGHLQTACPHGRRGLLASDKEVIGEPIYDDDEEDENVEEEQVCRDTGTFLMLRRNCLAPKASEDGQRTSLFSSTCTVKGKVCRFVIDSGCSSNVVSEEAVRKLSLTTESHPHPYRLLWMQTSA